MITKSWIWMKSQLGEYYAQRFLFSFCLHLPLVATFAFLAAIATKTIGKSYGVPLLLEHEDPGRQFFGGMFFAFAAGECLLLGCVFDSRRPRPSAGRAVKRLPLVFLGYATSVVLSFIVTAFALIGFFSLLQNRVRDNLPPPPDSSGEGAAGLAETFPYLFWLGAIVAMGVILLSVFAACGPVSRILGSKLKSIEKTVAHLRSLGWLRPGGPVSLQLAQLFIAPFILLFFVTVAFAFARWFRDSYYSAVVICLYFLYLLLAIYGFLYYIHPRLIPLLLLIGILLLTLGGLPVHKYRLEELAKWYKQDRLRKPYDVLKEPDKAQWAAEDPDHGEAEKLEDRLIKIDEVTFRNPGEPKKPLVVIVASGGGLRAAAWTFAMLERLEDEFRASEIDLPRHLRLIAGASGGMLGAAYYVATLPDAEHETPDAESRKQGFTDRYRRLTMDSLTPILDEMFFSDLPASFSPWPQTRDRGAELEKAWKKNLEGALDIPFASLRAGERAGWRPSIVFSPMMIEDGRRLFISNLDLQRVVRNAGNVLAQADQTYSFEGIEFFRRFRQAPLKLSTAARLSASFPFFSPAVVLPTWPRRRVVDAGYYDNYGVSVAASYLFSTTHQKWILANASGVILIQIRDGLSQNERKMGVVPLDAKESAPRQLSIAVEEFTSPLEGLLNARVSTASYRNDGMLELLSSFFKEVDAGKTGTTPAESFFFTTATFEYPGPASLNWYLTRRERANIRAAAGLAPVSEWPEAALTGEQEKARRKIDEDIDALKVWWLVRKKSLEEPSSEGVPRDSTGRYADTNEGQDP